MAGWLSLLVYRGLGRFRWLSGARLYADGWADWFSEMQAQTNGNGRQDPPDLVLASGPRDQPALLAWLVRLHNLNLAITSTVNVP